MNVAGADHPHYWLVQAPEMLSKPTFEVDLIKAGGKTLSFTCSFVGEEEHPEGQEGEGDGRALVTTPP